MFYLVLTILLSCISIQRYRQLQLQIERYLYHKSSYRLILHLQTLLKAAAKISEAEALPSFTSNTYGSVILNVP